MPKVYIVKDKTDRNFRKLFVKLFASESGAIQEVKQIQNKLNTRLHDLISYESINVSETDSNKNSIYIIYNKLDSNTRQPIVDMCSTYSNACKTLDKELNKYKGVNNIQKLIYMQSEPIHP